MTLGALIRSEGWAGREVRIQEPHSCNFLLSGRARQWRVPIPHSPWSSQWSERIQISEPYRLLVKMRIRYTSWGSCEDLLSSIDRRVEI